MRSGHRDRPPSAAALVSTAQDTAEPELFRMLLPHAHTSILKGKAAVWDRHYQQSQRAFSTTPTRPQTSHRSSPTSSPSHTTRPSVSSPIKTFATQQCKRPGTSASPRRQKVASPRRPLSARAATDPRLEANDSESVDADDYDYTNTGNPLPLKIAAREHLELKACMLAHMHRIDVDALHHLRETACRQLDESKTKQLLARGGVLDDGSMMETTKRKTAFLLRHFFALGEPSASAASVKQESILHDVIDEWSCRDNASPDDITALWKSVVTHIESSYILRCQLVVSTDPHPLSLTIAMDCLRKLPAKLPDYRRMLDVIITLIESGLSFPLGPPAERDNSNTVDASTVGRRFYVDECSALRDALTHMRNEKRTRVAAEALHKNTANSQTPRQQLATLLTSLKAGGPDDIDAVFTLFFQSNTRRLAPVALREALQVCFASHTRSDESTRLFFDTWMPLLQPEDVSQVLLQLTTHHASAFQSFFHEEFDAMDKLLMEPIAPPTPVTPAATARRRSSLAVDMSTDIIRPRRRTSRTSIASAPDAPAATLFHELIERHPAQFAAVLWASPYLTAHVFQDAHHLIARILEQNIVLVSHVLQQHPDVLMTLLNHTLKDNAIAIDEFFQTHPKALSDVLLHKGPAVATAIKSSPSILADILHGSQATLAKVLLTMPELMCHLFKSTPELLAQTIREDGTILSLAFSVVPQCLSDALERHPELLVDVAHRKPALIAKVFAKYPDLLLEPLETNPSVFSNFLVYHRKILPDFSSPKFDPAFFQFERKQFVERGQQTEKRLCKYDGKLRLRERLHFQEDAQAFAIRQTLGRTAVATSPNGRTTPGSGGHGRTTPGFTSDGPVIKDAKGVAGSLFIPSPSQVMSEMARLYVAKLTADAQTDISGKKRRGLVKFVLDQYIQELGFKSKAQKKLTLLLAGAKHAEQENLRIKWFLRFMNAGSILSAPVAEHSTAETCDQVWTSFHPLASAFYQTAMQYLVALRNEQLVNCLEDELTRPCLVGYMRVKQFLDEPLMLRILPTKDQRQQLLLSICEKEQLIHGETTATTKSSSAVAAAVTVTVITTLHLDDVLESLMGVWIQFQDRIRSEWTMQFQLVNPDGSGVVRYNTFADLVRAKCPAMEDRAILKIYHQCGEENDLGEYFIAVDDFSLAMSIVQEQDAIRDYAARTVVDSS